MRVLIVDDERLARMELRRLLKEGHSDAIVVGECADAVAAREHIAVERPDLLLLDVQMPEEDGFALLASLPPPVPRVVFVTAYDEHALRAFRVNALDYLVKPVEPEALAEALGRARAWCADPGQRDEHTAETDERLKPSDQVFVQDGERCLFVRVDSILLVEAQDNYTRLVLADKAVQVHRPLAHLEKRLPESLFFRANRSQLFNLDAVKRLTPWFSGCLRAVLVNGTEVELSRRRTQVFRQLREL